MPSACCCGNVDSIHDVIRSSRLARGALATRKMKLSAAVVVPLPGVNNIKHKHLESIPSASPSLLLLVLEMVLYLLSAVVVVPLPSVNTVKHEHLEILP